MQCWYIYVFLCVYVCYIGTQTHVIHVSVSGVVEHGQIKTVWSIWKLRYSVVVVCYFKAAQRNQQLMKLLELKGKVSIIGSSQNCHLTLQSPSALWSVSASLSSFFYLTACSFNVSVSHCSHLVWWRFPMGCNEVTACHEGLRKKTSSAFICVGLVNTEGFAWAYKVFLPERGSWNSLFLVWWGSFIILHKSYRWSTALCMAYGTWVVKPLLECFPKH